ncbi:MAG: MurR/RpiR family transcriptional regulator [Lachnospiraceae bacterium]|nr:MurR/RpiR family transcriptional regulator [Lachnospiraceae bacterium]
MKNVLIRIKQYREQASVSEQGALDFILSSPETAAECSIHQLAEQSYCSPSTIVRLCRKLGFEGYRELHKALLCELTVRQQTSQEKGDSLDRTEQLSDIISGVTHRNISSLEDTLHIVDPEEVQKGVDLIANCDTLLLFGLGASQLVAEDAYLKFLRINKPCTCACDIHSQYLQARNARPGDAAIIISYSGYTEEMIRCARDLKSRRTPIIAITRFVHSPLTQLADCCLYVVTTEELFRSGAMASRIAQLNIIDILYTTYFNRDFDRNLQYLEHNQLTKETVLE